MRNWITVAVLYVTVMITAAQCSIISLGQASPPQIKVTEARSRAAIAGTNGVVYFTLLNEGGSPDVLLNVETGVAIAELHESQIDEQGIMRMGPITNVEIPAGGSASLEPGGKHVMLINLKRDLTSGEKISLTLNFQKSGSMQIEAKVTADGTLPEHNMDEM